MISQKNDILTFDSLGLTGSDPRLKIDYEYNDWDAQGGRLQYLKAGTVANPTSLQDLTYNYDNNGNPSTSSGQA